MKGFLINAYDRLCHGCAYVSAWMMFGMALVVTYDVIVRYIFGSPTSWAVDFTNYIMFYSTFLAAAWLLKEEGHITLTLLVERLSERSQIVMKLINSFIGVIISCIMIWYGVADCWDALVWGIVIDAAMLVPKYLLIGVIPFGFLLLLVQFTRDGLRALGTLRTMSREA